MKINVLYENTRKDDTLVCGHGLSVLIETNSNKILMDTGRDESFISNAEALGINLKDVGFAVISHFHYDHSGGLTAFLEYNKKAKIIVSSSFFNKFYSIVDGAKTEITLSKNNFDLSRFIFVDRDYDLYENVKIISNLGYKHNNLLNKKFMIKRNGELMQDDFSHELAIVIDECKKTTVISGCYHSGVVNAATKAEKIGKAVTHVVGGFHLTNFRGTDVSEKYFDELLSFIKERNIDCYTGHCTGTAHFNRMKKEIPEQLNYIYTGSEYTI